MRNIEKQGVRIAKKKKRLNLQKAFTEKFKALYMLSHFQRRIQDPVKHRWSFFGKAVTGFWPLFLQKCSIVYVRLDYKQAYDSYRQTFYFCNFETLKVEKNSFTRVSEMNWLTNKKVAKIFLRICLISCHCKRNFFVLTLRTQGSFYIHGFIERQ